MRRRTFDVIASTIGLGLAALLLVAGGLLTWAHGFVGDQVHAQLSEQKIFFPPKGSDAIKELPAADAAAMNKYAGQQLTTGDQAATYANHFIRIHLQGIGGGKTYSELSGAAMKDPNNQKLQGQVATMFKGETLRGLLLNAYAFGKMGVIAGIGAIVAWLGGALFALLGALGLWHAHRVPVEQEVLAGKKVKHTATEPAIAD